MGWFGNKVLNWATKTQSNELQQFVTRLQAIDSNELGMIVACATDCRHRAKAEFEWDLLEPALTEATDISVAIKLGQIIRSLQRNNQPQIAVGYMVWLHTVRASSNPDLRQLGRQMWRELSRGFSEVKSAADGAAYLLGYAFDIEGFDQFPTGLTPEPV